MCVVVLLLNVVPQKKERLCSVFHCRRPSDSLVCVISACFHQKNNTVIATVVKNKIHVSGKFRYYHSTIFLCSEITSPSNYLGISSTPSQFTSTSELWEGLAAPLPSSNRYFPEFGL